MSRIWGALLSVMILSGCGTREPAVPDAVRQMMNTDFPADGKIHVQSRGEIVIKPETPVCETWLAADDPQNFIGIDSNLLFGTLGQSKSNAGGSDRQMAASASVCGNVGSVVIHGVKLANRNGQPYKLVLAVWQGDPARGGAVWVGRVERADGIRPDQRNKRPFRDGIPAPSWIMKSQDRDYQIKMSIQNDVRDLSTFFSKYVAGGER